MYVADYSLRHNIRAEDVDLPASASDETKQTKQREMAVLHVEVCLPKALPVRGCVRGYTGAELTQSMLPFWERSRGQKGEVAVYLFLYMNIAGGIRDIALR